MEDFDTYSHYWYSDEMLLSSIPRRFIFQIGDSDLNEFEHSISKLSIK